MDRQIFKKTLEFLKFLNNLKKQKEDGIKMNDKMDKRTDVEESNNFKEGERNKEEEEEGKFEEEGRNEERLKEKGMQIKEEIGPKRKEGGKQEVGKKEEMKREGGGKEEEGDRRRARGEKVKREEGLFEMIFDKEIRFEIFTHLLRFFCNLTHINKEAQEFLLKEDYLFLLLGFTNFDEENPLMKEWSIFLIRNLTESKI